MKSIMVPSLVVLCRLGALFLVGLVLAGGPLRAGDYYTQQTTFLIPFQTDPNERRIQQVLLHVSEDGGRSYQQVGVASPQDKSFRFQARRDGWYYFTVQTQDNMGQFHPANVQAVAPGLRVCVDTTQPQVVLRPAVVREGPAGVEWEVRDENPDVSSLRLEYRPVGSRDWYPLNTPQQLSGQYGWMPPTTGPLEVRLQVRDKAGNSAQATTLLTPNGGGASPMSPTPPGPGNLIYVNRRRFHLNYKLENVGKSGVANVEVWMTQNGQSWQKYADAGKDPPYAVEVQSEGRYGFTLVAVSGVGLSERRPRAGDPPQVWVEVDDTKPIVRLLNVEVGQGNDANKLTVRWAAQDRHLKNLPITLSYSETPAGPWKPIATELPNDGRYVWSMPQDGLPFQFLVRVEAADLAGNVGHDETTKPVAVDLTLPKTAIIGVEPAPSAKMPPPP
jgi:hypothetical protein